jgi:hypothetical protein
VRRGPPPARGSQRWQSPRPLPLPLATGWLSCCRPHATAGTGGTSRVSGLKQAPRGPAGSVTCLEAENWLHVLTLQQDCVAHPLAQPVRNVQGGLHLGVGVVEAQAQHSGVRRPWGKGQKVTAPGRRGCEPLSGPASHAPGTHRDFVHPGRQDAAQVAVEVALHRVWAAVDGDQDAWCYAQLFGGYQRGSLHRGRCSRLLRRCHVDGDERARPGAARPRGRPGAQAAAAVVATLQGGRSAGRPCLRAAPPWPHRLRGVGVCAMHLAELASHGDVSALPRSFTNGQAGCVVCLYRNGAWRTYMVRLVLAAQAGGGLCRPTAGQLDVCAPSPCGAGWRLPLPPGWQPARCLPDSSSGAPAPSGPPWPGPPGWRRSPL